ncbi:hypothetical protein [Nitrosospira sp. Is2]|uniref:hypothetical protein n=1 Tax=Nitrosospira sp. Is2 TaxID=3080532 RepID=UPI0029532AEB|nr:hypothetical protein [Nitrosospira sp. Is2]WON74240.1 hypothetical protein R5L00_01760 [Nitrosospira sp. Is2]
MLPTDVRGSWARNQPTDCGGLLLAPHPPRDIVTGMPRILIQGRAGLPQSPASGFRHRAMVIAMTIVRIMEMSIDQIINMVAMRYCLMPTARPMHMLRRVSGAFMLRRAVLRIGRGYANHMFVDMAFVRMMQMAVVQIIDMVIVHDPGVAALRPMRMIMIFVLLRGTMAH